MPIASTDLVISKVSDNCTVEAFCKEKNLDPTQNNLSILLEFNTIDKSMIRKVRDVILMDKVLQ